LNLQLLQNIDKLEAANKDLDRFAFMASHDLQEPLRKIRIFTERLTHRLNGKMDEESVSYLDRIQRGTERMQNLIKDIMTFSRMSNDNGPFVDSDLNILVSDVLVELEENIREKSAKVEVGQLPVMKLKPRLIHPLFYNLLNNAIKYSRKDVSPEIKIYAETISTMTAGNITRSRRFCRIFIEDNGIGFEQKYSEQIFEMFKRLHQ
jgi:light-regulated signal transduction histidine kinase (bacteriophytochrome)